MNKKLYSFLVLSVSLTIIFVNIHAEESQEDSQLLINSQNANNDGCILCQYIVERLDRRIKEMGIVPASVARPNRDSKPRSTNPSLIESQSQSHQFVFGMSEPAPVTPSHPTYAGAYQSTTPSYPHPHNMPLDVSDPGYHQYFDKLEWQLYQNINHAIDIAMDEVCESSMPNDYYQYCKIIFKRQDSVVNMLGRSFFPRDVCINLNVCNKSSYIFQMKHTAFVSDAHLNQHRQAMTFEDQYNQKAKPNPGLWE